VGGQLGVVLLNRIVITPEALETPLEGEGRLQLLFFQQRCGAPFAFTAGSSGLAEASRCRYYMGL
jgi:hypothetical protein